MPVPLVKYTLEGLPWRTSTAKSSGWISVWTNESPYKWGMNEIGSGYYKLKILKVYAFSTEDTEDLSSK